MFVKNLTKKEIRYNFGGNTLVLKPGVNIFNEVKFPVDELKKVYGPQYLAFYMDEQPAENDKLSTAKKEQPVEKKDEEVAPAGAKGEEVASEGEVAGEAGKNEEVAKEVAKEVKDEAGKDEKKPAGNKAKATNKTTKNK